MQPIFDEVVRRHEIESRHSEHLDQKASNQVGFVGIILAIFASFFGFYDIEFIQKGVDFVLLFWGLGLLLVSLIVGIVVLTPFFRSRAYLDIKEFYEDFKGESDKKQKSLLIQIYFTIIEDMLRRNNQKAIVLYVANGFTLAGMIISFISLTPIIGLIG